MTMVGEVRLNSTGQPTYNEWLYKDGQMIMHSLALCQYDRPASTDPATAQFFRDFLRSGSKRLPDLCGSGSEPLPDVCSKIASSASNNPPPLSVIDGTRSNQTGKRIPLRLSGNSYIVPVLINGRIWLDFILDTGASDVTIPDDVATTLMRAGTITKEDIGREQNYRTANGGTVKGTQFRIHSLQVGEGDNAVIAQNVDGSIGGPQGSLLLGQSFLRRFRSTTIDHVNSVLIIGGSEPLAAPAHPNAPIPPPPAPIQTEADRKAAALRDAAINPASLAMNLMIGTKWGGNWRGERVADWVPNVFPNLSGTVVNHSNKPLRAIEIQVQVRDCPQCLVTDEWSRRIEVNVPPGQQRNFDDRLVDGLRLDPGGQAWRIKSIPPCISGSVARSSKKSAMRWARADSWTRVVGERSVLGRVISQPHTAMPSHMVRLFHELTFAITRSGRHSLINYHDSA
jgi:hypothetical protein